MGKKEKQKAQVLNDLTYYMYFNRLKDYCLSMFKWEGLPPSINERFLELTLFEKGSAVFFEDPNLGLMALPVTPKGQVNAYQEPTSYQAISIGYSKDLEMDEGVIMWNNLSRTPILPIVDLFATRLMKATRATDVNIDTQKFPMIFLTDESQRLTMQNLMESYEGNEPFIFGNKQGFNPESVQALVTGIPYVADKLMEYRHNLWNEAMTFLGIGNAKQDKKERLVADEVAANDEQVESSRFVMLSARQIACEKINAMFGTSIQVDFKLNEVQENPEEEDINED